MPTLLEKAKLIAVKRVNAPKFDHEATELTLAYLKGDITAPQYAEVIGKSSSNINGRIVSIMKGAAKSGRLKFDLEH